MEFGEKLECGVVPVLGGPELRYLKLIENPNRPLESESLVTGHPLIPKAVLSCSSRAKELRPVLVMLRFNKLCREDSHIKCVFLLSVLGRGAMHAMP